MLSIWEFAREWFRRWWASMSCAAFTGLTVVLALWPDQSKVNALFVRGSGALAILFSWIASYGAWKRQRDLYQTELAKNVRPEIKGEAYDFCRDPSGSIMHAMSSANEHSVRVPFNFTLAISNHRQVTTNLSRLIIDASKVQPAMELSGVSYPYAIELEYAKIVRFLVTGNAIIKADPSSIGAVRLDHLKIIVVDGLGDNHEIAVHPHSQWPLRSY